MSSPFSSLEERQSNSEWLCGYGAAIADLIRQDGDIWKVARAAIQARKIKVTDFRDAGLPDSELALLQAALLLTISDD